MVAGTSRLALEFFYKTLNDMLEHTVYLNCLLYLQIIEVSIMISKVYKTTEVFIIIVQRVLYTLAESDLSQVWKILREE